MTPVPSPSSPSIQIKTSIPIIITSCTITALVSIATHSYLHKQRRQKQSKTDNISTRGNETNLEGYEALIGTTPLIRLPSLSSSLGGKNKSIYVKMESLNPGGTGKDRAALQMLRDAEKRGDLPLPLSLDDDDDKNGESLNVNGAKMGENENEPSDIAVDAFTASISQAMKRTKTGGIVVEGTSGSTGISLASLCTSRGHSVIVVMPDDQALEKREMLRRLGVVLHVVQNCAISNPNHYVNVARRIAQEINKNHSNDHDDGKREIKAFFVNQFENLSNYNAHYTTTGPEIYQQTNGNISAFVMSSGTGGTISGVGQYLKDQTNHKCRIVLVDPPGSSLFNKVKYGVAYAEEQCERNMKRHRYDTIAEGIGLDRVTQNFKKGVDGAVFDDAVRISDQEALDMAHWLLRYEGLFVGSSSAMNVAGAVRCAKEMGDGCVVVTVICDGGYRHLTRFWNREFVEDWGLVWPNKEEGENSGCS